MHNLERTYQSPLLIAVQRADWLWVMGNPYGRTSRHEEGRWLRYASLDRRLAGSRGITALDYGLLTAQRPLRPCILAGLRHELCIDAKVPDRGM